MEKAKTNIIRLTESAVMLALATVLSQIKVMEMPMGGSITAFSMLPVIIIAYRYGTKWGLFTGLAGGLLQMLLGMQNLKYGASFMAVLCIILFDYLIAFAGEGFGGLFRGKLKYQWLELGAGAFVACVIRFACHFISGITIWGMWAPEGMPVWQYSLVYNGTYMLFETIITVAGAILISFVLDFTSKDITRRKLKAEAPEAPRNSAAYTAKLTGTAVSIGGVLYVIAAAVLNFTASLTDETVGALNVTLLLTVLGGTLFAGVLLYAIGELVQLVSDLKHKKSE